MKIVKIVEMINSNVLKRNFVTIGNFNNNYNNYKFKPYNFYSSKEIRGSEIRIRIFCVKVLIIFV